MRKKKAAKREKQRWVELPQRDYWSWASEWIVSSIVLRAIELGKGKMPKRVSVPEDCITEEPDGSALLHFNVKY